MKYKKFVVTECAIQSKKIRKEITIVQISDLHNCCDGERNVLLSDAVRRANPDLIVCTGDLFNRKDSSRFREALQLIKMIIPIAPVYVIEGNHESALGLTGESYLNEIESMGARVLKNDAVNFCGIRMIGLKEHAECSLIDELASDVDFNLVLSHRPELFPEYAETKADLVLCGHAHGGQIRIGNTPIYAPEQGMFPKYTSGLYEKNTTKMYVSRGLGDTIIIPRIHNPHELTVIRLLPDNNQN